MDALDFISVTNDMCICILCVYCVYIVCICMYMYVQVCTV